MHAKARCEFSVSSRPAQCLEEMNLGEVVPLTPDEARYFQCRDVRGRIVDGVYSAPVVRTAVPNAVGSRVVTSIKKVAVLQNEMSSLNIMSDRCVADAWAGRKSAGVIRMGPQDQAASSARGFEQEVNAWHRPRVSAARVVLEEADRLYRKGRNPGEGIVGQNFSSGDCSDAAVSRVRSRKCSGRVAGCGGTWKWRVELRKRAVLQSKARQCAVVCRDRRGIVMESVREQRVLAEKLCVESKSRARHHWWAACKSYECAVMQCCERSELLKLMRQSDRQVVNWYSLGVCGLRARVAGGSRVCLRRVSPGCGVHRRKKHGVRCAARLAKCAQSGRAVRLVEDAQSAGAPPMCGHAVECGSR